MLSRHRDHLHIARHFGTDTSYCVGICARCCHRADYLPTEQTADIHIEHTASVSIRPHTYGVCHVHIETPSANPSTLPIYPLTYLHIHLPTYLPTCRAAHPEPMSLSCRAAFPSTPRHAPFTGRTTPIEARSRRPHTLSTV
eukprot:3251935-Pleurochrysis_carterae.AAC.1